MVYIPPPQLASATRSSYAEAYSGILAAHRRSPHTSASSVAILCAPDVDALCAARMLAELFKQDDVMHQIIPVSGIGHLNSVRDELTTYADVRHYVSIYTSALNNSPTATYTYHVEHGLYLGTIKT